jgi:hypothetical protein
MISTTPMTLSALLDEWQLLADKLKDDGKKKEATSCITDARNAATALNTKGDELAQAADADPRDEAKVAQLDQQVESAQSSLVSLLKRIRKILGIQSKLAQGTPDNPIPIDWPKHAAAEYPVLHYMSETKHFDALITKKTPEQVKAGLSKADQGLWDKDPPVTKEYDPCTQSKLPNGDEIGIAPPYQIAVGMTFEMKSSAGTGGGGKINRRLAEYGYSASREGMDGDHVVERQVGGPDNFANLWPLDSGENRGSGSTIRGMVFDNEGDPISMDDVKEEVRAQKGKQGVWFRINSTL